ncbi:MAG: 2-oxoacid:ferredoxin oxidoreductase subunit beta [Deltaproteobacteria bacterium]|nr:2-oxoacid:ferredoxin oxidoreductase subunit beta [Deltaproteobacteria bacterium]
MTSRPVAENSDPSKLTRKDFVSDQEVRWCPGCADYSILAQVQRTLPTLGIPKENYVFVSGIGCSSRFPYYMDTFGIHGIHGRAPAIATGIKIARPELSVWVVTGDGDALSIGGNHLLHSLRRNIGLKILMFNNRIYGLTKGQYSPTSELGKKTKSTPIGSVDYPVDPVGLALGAGATFVARALGTDAQQMQEILARAARHRGTAFVEIYQTCVIFNDDSFADLADAATKDERRVLLSQGKPLRFGKNQERGIILDSSGKPKVVGVAEHGAENLLVHDEGSDTLPFLLARLGAPEFPVPMGIFRAIERPSYEELVTEQVRVAQGKRSGTVQSLLNSGDTWTVGGQG